MMFRILKAFAWMRWRMLVNSLEKTGSRDALERFSLAIEKLGPILAAILLIPSAIGLAGLGVAAGYLLATGGSGAPFTAVRFLLIVAPLLAVIGPLFLPAADRTNPIRLLLLPIPRSTLYVAQSSAAFGDPWNVLLIPLVAGLPAGLAAGGRITAALLCLFAAILFVLLVIGLSSLATSILHLVVRDRRRGELAALIFIVIIPVVAMLPGLLDGDSRRSRGRPSAPIVPGWAADLGGRAKDLYPSELLVNVTRAAADADTARVAAAIAALAAGVVLIHGFGVLTFRRVLASPGSTGSRRAAQTRAVWGARLPGLSSGASAVALAQLRLAMRTPRGRSILLSPLAMFGIFALLMYRGAGQMDFGPFRFGSGLGLAAFASFICLLSILPVAMNQFAVDRAGLTMTLLSPLKDDEILAGKAAGNALIVAVPTLVSVTGALLMFGGGPAGLWLTLLLALVSVQLLVAPIAAIVSATFPRAVDMNSIGRGSNAHGAAGFIGMLTFLATGAAPGLLTLLAIRVLERPPLAPVLVALWCVVAYIAGRLLFMVARRVFANRRENLAMVH